MYPSFTRPLRRSAKSYTATLSRSVAVGVVLVAGACSLAGRRPASPIDPGVLEAVRAQDSVAVLVSLVPPSNPDRAPSDALQREIRRIQDAVLEGLEPDSYLILRRFESVPAMTLVVYDEATVRRLARQEHVERIGLDDGGGGGSP